MSYKPDESEVRADVHRLHLKAKYLAAELETVTSSRIETPALSRDVLADHAMLETHCAELETKLNQARANAATISQPRRSMSESASPAGLVAKSGAADLSATDQVLVAKGVSSIEEARENRLQESQFMRFPKTVNPKILNDPNLTATEKCLAAKRQQNQ